MTESHHSNSTGSGRVVLDASALIALLADEPGADEVSGLVTSSLMSAVNLAEVLQWGIRRGEPIDTLPSSLNGAGLQFLDFDPERAAQAANLRFTGRSVGLSHGDRACLGLARILGLPAITAERAWSRVDLGVHIRLIR